MRRTIEAMSEGVVLDPARERARLNEYGELEPVAVDESLTSLLFATRPAPAAPPEPLPSPLPFDRPAPERSPEGHSTALLFEMV